MNKCTPPPQVMFQLHCRSALRTQWPARQPHLPTRHPLPLSLQTQRALLLQKLLCSQVWPLVQPLQMAKLSPSFELVVLQPLPSLRTPPWKHIWVHVNIPYTSIRLLPADEVDGMECRTSRPCPGGTAIGACGTPERATAASALLDASRAGRILSAPADSCRGASPCCTLLSWDSTPAAGRKAASHPGILIPDTAASKRTSVHAPARLGAIICPRGVLSTSAGRAVMCSCTHPLTQSTLGAFCGQDAEQKHPIGSLYNSPEWHAPSRT